MSKTISFSHATYIEKEPIIIYGASVYGELAYISLKQMGYKPDYFCDKSEHRKECFEIEVLRPGRLEKFKDANIIIASADYFHEIVEMLENIGCCNLFDMTEMLEMELPKEQLSNRALEMYDNRQNYINIVQKQEEGKLNFNRIQYVVSERCSLKCRDCTHLMQYYQQPQDVDLDKYKAAFELLLQCVDSVAELRILGGEPFMNRDMGKVIDWHHGNSKIQRISVYTNGTIVPNEITLRELQRSKIKVHISNYKTNEEKIGKLIKVFDEYHIQYFTRVYDAWQDAGGVEFRDHSIEQMEDIFSNCFERNCFTFLKGQLHRCPRSAHAMNLGAMPDVKEDYVDLLHWNGTKEELVEKLKNLQKRSWIEACNYCGGPNNITQSIPAGIQISKPIEYTSYINKGNCYEED